MLHPGTAASQAMHNRQQLPPPQQLPLPQLLRLPRPLRQRTLQQRTCTTAQCSLGRLTSFMAHPPTAISTLRSGFVCFRASVSPYSWLSSFHSTGFSEKSVHRVKGLCVTYPAL